MVCRLQGWQHPILQCHERLWDTFFLVRKGGKRKRGGEPILVVVVALPPPMTGELESTPLVPPPHSLSLFLALSLVGTFLHFFCNADIQSTLSQIYFDDASIVLLTYVYVCVKVPPPESETGAGNSNPIPPPDVTCTPLITGVGKHAQSSKHPATPSSSSSSSCVFDENTKYTNGTGVTTVSPSPL